jgi:hypothetical protein
MNNTDLDKETIDKLSDALSSIPDKISGLSLHILIAPTAAMKMFPNDPEMRYRFKFCVERSLKAAKNIIADCETALKEFENPPKD